jgi:transcriptional regulator with XRE-family HTH domain
MLSARLVCVLTLNELVRNYNRPWGEPGRATFPPKLLGPPLDISSSKPYLSVVPRKLGRLAQFLRNAREAASLSLRQVEKLTGISNPYLSQLENGHTINPSPHVLAKLARAYDRPYGELMAAAGYSDEAPRDTTLRVAMLASRLDTAEQTEVEKFINHLIAQRVRGQ